MKEVKSIVSNSNSLIQHGLMLLFAVPVLSNTHTNPQTSKTESSRNTWCSARRDNNKTKYIHPIIPVLLNCKKRFLKSKFHPTDKRCSQLPALEILQEMHAVSFKRCNTLNPQCTPLETLEHLGYSFPVQSNCNGSTSEC